MNLNLNLNLNKRNSGDAAWRPGPCSHNSNYSRFDSDHHAHTFIWPRWWTWLAHAWARPEHKSARDLT